MRSSEMTGAVWPPNTLLRRGMPYGIVMATAGASTLAGRCGLRALVTPLLILAIAQALWIPIAGMWRHRAEPRPEWRAWWMIGPAHEHSGIHTVPLGAAVIVGGLVSLAPSSSIAAWPLALVAGCLALTWLLTIICVTRFAWSLLSRGLTLRTLDGVWFLAPAALLGAAIATDAFAGLLAGRGASAMATLALVAALLGWLGYWAVAYAALARMRRHGLEGAPQAPWWIAMGCAGLAAAALGRALSGPIPDWPLHGMMTDAMVLTDVVAIILLIPILIGSVVFLLRLRQFDADAPWTPTFSTAVFALGCLETGVVLRSPGFHLLGLGAGYATLLFWTLTTAWNTWRGLRRQLVPQLDRPADPAIGRADEDLADQPAERAQAAQQDERARHTPRQHT